MAVKKILLVSNMYPSEGQPYYGIFVKNFETSLDAASFKVASKAVIKGRGKSSLHKLFKYVIFSFDVILKGLFTKYDIIYVHYINHSSIPVMLLRMLKSSPKLVLNAHGGDILHNSRLAKLIFIFTKLNLSKASLIVVPSTYFKKEVERILVGKTKQFCISPSGGVNLDLFRPVSGNKESDELVLGFIGRIDRGKGWELFLQAISYLNFQEKIKVRGYVVGNGGQTREFLLMINDLGIKDLIEYNPRVPQRELINHFGKLDLFIFPSHSESLGLVGIEAMACGIPVIGSDCGGISSYLEDGVQGYIFKNGNVTSLIEAIIRYRNLNSKEKELFRLNAMKQSRHFDAKKVACYLNNEILSIFN